MGVSADAPMRVSDLWTPAGALTTVRLVMAATLPYFLHTAWVLPLYLLAVGTDVADGAVARRFGHATRAGAAYDAWVDKSLHVNLGWALAVADRVPDWYMLCWFAREIIQLPMHFFLMHRFRVAAAPPPRTSGWGRATAVVLALAFVGALAGAEGSAVVCALTVASGVLGTIAAVDYGLLFFGMKRDPAVVRATEPGT